MNQQDRILQYVAEHGSITSREAMIDLGIMRLASRIYDLKQSGYAVERTMEVSDNRYGDPSPYARYYIKEGDTECQLTQPTV